MGLAQDFLQLSPEQLENFEEFHACELYGGFKMFEGVDQDRRFEAIRRLLALLEMCDLCVVYGAVDLDRLGKAIYASADPLDICFRICASGMTSWTEQRQHANLQAKLGENAENYTLENMTPYLVDGILYELILVIVDDCDKKIRETLHKTYRSLRPQRRAKDQSPFTVFHDDMYFGDSRYSIGIQLADLCSYFIARHLEGDDETESFYEMIEPHIVNYQIHPPINIEEVNIVMPKESTDGK